MIDGMARGWRGRSIEPVLEDSRARVVGAKRIEFVVKAYDTIFAWIRQGEFLMPDVRNI